MSQDASNRQDEGTNVANSSENPANSKQDVQGMEPSNASNEAHRLSIGLVVGATMGAIGIILLLQGLFGTTANYKLSDGININIWWGLVLIVFCIIMCGGNFLIARRHANP